MRFGCPFVLVILFVGQACYAQNAAEIGAIAPPVLDAPAKPAPINPVIDRFENRVQAETETAGPVSDQNQLNLPNLKLPSSDTPIQLESDFSSIKQSAKYRLVEIVTPANNSTLVIATTNLVIKANLAPPVRSDLGHMLQITLDDEVLVENVMDFMLDDIEIGTHTIKLKIVDEDQNVVAQSKPITVHIK